MNEREYILVNNYVNITQALDALRKVYFGEGEIGISADEFTKLKNMIWELKIRTHDMIEIDKSAEE